MLSQNREFGHGTQLRLTIFQNHSIKAYVRVKETGRKKSQQVRILERLSMGPCTANQLDVIAPQYNARIYSLRRGGGKCIVSKVVEGIDYFYLNASPHMFDNERECAVCGTPKGEE